MKEHVSQSQRIDERTFSVVRKGYDPREVKTYLEELEHAFQDMEGHSRRTSQKVIELERELKAARTTEKASLDNAMMAVFDVKDRMMYRAERKARELQEEAGKAASQLLAEASAARGREPELEARITELEQELVTNRANSERLRMQLNDAHATLDRLESTTTVDITSLQAQLKHEQEQNAQLRAEARDLDFVRREFEHKLATAQEQTMRARAKAEAIAAELEQLMNGDTEAAPAETGRVVYERPDDLADYEFVVTAYEADADGVRVQQAN